MFTSLNFLLNIIRFEEDLDNFKLILIWSLRHKDGFIVRSDRHRNGRIIASHVATIRFVILQVESESCRRAKLKRLRLVISSSLKSL